MRKQDKTQANTRKLSIRTKVNGEMTIDALDTAR